MRGHASGHERKVLPTLLCPWISADSRLLKIHEGASPVTLVPSFFVRQMSGVPPKSTHAGGGKVGSRHDDDTTREGA